MSNLPKNGTLGNYTIFNPKGNMYFVCFKENKTITDNLWEAANPLNTSVPRFFLQICVLVLLTRILIFLLKRLHQPRFIAEVLTGFILGPTIFGQPEWLSGQNGLIPFEGALVMETLANLGLTYYMFLVGLEMDPTPIRKANKETLAVSFAGLAFQLAAGLGLYKLLDDTTTGSRLVQGPAFWAIALTVTSFPDLARLLSSLKLLHTDLAKNALTSAVISDVFTWSMLLMVVTINTGDTKSSPTKVVPILVYLVVFWFVIRPLIHWAISRVGSKEELPTEGRFKDEHLVYVLTAVLLCGFATELCGSHSMIGAFLLGLSIPSGEFGTKIMDRIEEYVIGIALPPVFLVTGMRTNIRSTFDFINLKIIIAEVVLAFFIKIVSTLLSSLYFKKPLRESLVLGVLMNTKGILAIIVLNEGRNLKGFNQPIFGLVMLMIFVMTALVGPIVRFAYKSSIRGRYFRRTLEKGKQGSDLRVLVCVHSANHVNGMIGLLLHSNATLKSPITVFAVHLVELTGRAAAMLIFHDTNRSSFSGRHHDDSNHNVSREKAEADNVLSAFHPFTKDKSSAISIQLLTAVSPYPTMHEDIGNFALDKSASIVLVPFHKHIENDDSELTDQQLQQRRVTQNLLEIAPCSVGILVDRGTTSDSHEGGPTKRLSVAMFFIGGCDDREALAYARRISGTRGMMLNVVRFIPGNDVEDMVPAESLDRDGIFDALMDWENEKQIDDDYINEFRFRTMYDQSVRYVEKTVNGCDEVLSAIQSKYDGYDLYIVGRGSGFASPLTVGMSDFNEYPELGPLGESLVSTGFISPASVLVIQQLPPSASRIRRHSTGANQMPTSTANAFVNHRKKYDDNWD